MKCVAKGVYPIDTGKVKIGAMYLPTKPHYCTDAELFWQGVLLGRRTVRPSLSTSVMRLRAVLRTLRFWRG